MPVIQLPRDTRFGELGDALGKALGGAVEAYQDNQLLTQVMNDPTISEADKPKKLITALGATKGATKYADYVKTQLMQSQIAENLAAAGLKSAQGKVQDMRAGVGTGNFAANTVDTYLQSAGGVSVTPEQRQSLIDQVTMRALTGTGDPAEPVRAFVESAGKGMLRPGEIAKQGMDIAAQKSVLPTVAPIAQSEQTIKGSQASAAPAAAAATVASAPTAVAQGQATLTGTQQSNAASAPTETTPAEVGDAYSSFTPEQKAAVATAARTGGAKAASTAIQSFVTANEAAARSGAPEVVRRVAELENRTRTFTNVMNDIEQNPQLQGGLMAGVVNPVLAKYGYDFGQITPADYGEMATSSQLALQALQGNRGFGGAYLVKAVAETMPTAAKQKLFKAIESNFQAQQDVVELESLKLAAADKGQNTAQIDAAIERARELERRTGTLWWTGDKRVFYKGREINPDTWVATPGGAREFESKDNIRIRDGVSMTGAELNQLARESGQVPEMILARLRGQSGALPQRR